MGFTAALETGHNSNQLTLNNFGSVAYAGLRFGSPQQIFTSPGPSGATVPRTEALLNHHSPAINDAGTLAFRTTPFITGDRSGVFVGSGPVFAEVASTRGPYSSFGGPALNNAGDLAFRAGFNVGGAGIFTGPDPVADNLVATNDQVFSSLFDPAINDAGTIAFRGNLLGGGSGIFTGPNPVADAVVTTGGSSYTGFGDPSINSGGTVAFRATLPGGVSGIFTGPDPVADAVVTTDGPYASFAETAPSINDAGVVAFYATLDDGGAGIFTGPDPVADKVVAVGDVSFDARVFSIDQVPVGTFLNDFGDVAFSFSRDEPGRFDTVGVAAASSRYSAAAGGSIDDPSNFVYGVVPGTVVPTFINPDNGLVVTGPTANRTIRSLNLGTAGSGVAELRLLPGGQLTVNELLTVQAQGKLRIDGVAAALGGVVNDGEIELVNDAQLNGGPLTNAGLLRGDGTVGNAVTNFGRIEAIGTAVNPTELRFTSPVANAAGTGLIVGRNAMLRFDGGLDNAGSLAVSFGTSDVFGDIDNTGTIAVTGGANATFYDDVVQNGTLRVSEVGSTTSVAVFLGDFSGAGGTTGGGDIFFEGDLRIGNSPAAVTFNNDVSLGDGSTTEIEIAGLATGEFDQFIINGDLSLDGTLSVVPLDGFLFGANQFFTIFDVSGTFSGTFAGLAEGGLVGNFGGTDLFVTYAAGPGGDVALFTVPEPASLTLLGLGGLALRRRPGKASR